jgi:hypothetical protein
MHGGGPDVVKAVARRLNGGGPCMVAVHIRVW